MLFFTFSYLGIQYEKRRKQNAKVKMQNLFFVPSTALDHGNFTSLDNRKDRPQKKLESVYKIRDVRFLEDVEYTKRM